jgi:hypothetical protein
VSDSGVKDSPKMVFKDPRVTVSIEQKVPVGTTVVSELSEIDEVKQD